MKKRIIPFIFLFSLCAYDSSFSDVVEKGAHALENTFIGKKPLSWRWRTIAWQSPNFLDSLSFPASFYWGVSSPGLDTLDQKLAGVEHMSAMGITMHSCTLDWSQIEPEEGAYNEQLLSEYADYMRSLRAVGIEPVVALGSDTWPAWFADCGAFEHEKNSELFVRYAVKVFEALHDSVHYWTTLDGPIGYAFEAYFRGEKWPYKKSLKLTGKVAAHMIHAHAACYKACKAIDAECQIGFAHTVHPLDPAHRWNPGERATAATFDRLLNRVALDYLTTGIFSWSVVGKKLVYFEHPGIKNSYDFIGINYHTRSLVSMGIRGMTNEQELVYAEGLYRAIALCSDFHAPMIIVQNGSAEHFDRVQSEYINKHLYAVSKALADGYDVRGYCYRSLVDTYTSQAASRGVCGLYGIDGATSEWYIKPSSRGFISFVKGFAHDA